MDKRKTIKIESDTDDILNLIMKEHNLPSRNAAIYYLYQQNKKPRKQLEHATLDMKHHYLKVIQEENKITVDNYIKITRYISDIIFNSIRNNESMEFYLYNLEKLLDLDPYNLHLDVEGDTDEPEVI